jgi:hypothetical protein
MREDHHVAQRQQRQVDRVGRQWNVSGHENPFFYRSNMDRRDAFSTRPHRYVVDEPQKVGRNRKRK